jgi:hypothetical protein
VKEFVRCAAQNEVLFSPPTVRFVFANGVTRSLRDKVVRRGATVGGRLVSLGAEEESDADEDSDDDSEDSSNCDSIEEGDCLAAAEEGSIDTSRVNLDITAMIAYVSALTNGRNCVQFAEKILSAQAQWERERPVKPFLDSVFRGKELVCCQSAMRDFKVCVRPAFVVERTRALQTIILTLGGPGERARADALVARVTVVPDTDR